MLGKYLEGIGLDELTSLLSPSFLHVVPTRRLIGAARELAHNYRDAVGYGRASSAMNASLHRSEWEIDVSTEPRPTDARPTRRSDGRALIGLYFHQIFRSETAFLDLRRGRFAGSEPDSGVMTWHVSRLWMTWDHAFIGAIRDMYAGFYDGDDDRFEDALERLGLSPASDLFRGHFGGGEQRNVTFDIARFRHTFLEILEHCSEAGTTLHRNFIPFGIYLATLYDHLDDLGGRYDVRDVFERTTRDEPRIKRR